MRRPPEPDCLRWVFHRALGLDASMPENEAWRSALSALHASRLSPLAGHLLGTGIATLSSDVRLVLEAATLHAESVTQRNQAQVGEMALGLREAAISWVALKSWPLSVRLYPSPSCRPSGDLDLLVSPKDAVAAEGALRKLGYLAQGGDRSYHTRCIRAGAHGIVDVIELHTAPGPPGFGGPTAEAILETRRAFETVAGEMWIPAPEVEFDLLVRHYLRHGGSQGILLLDLLLVGRRGGGAAGQVRHPLGSIVGDDLDRLGLERVIDGPRGLAQLPLRRWMGRRTFEQRRTSQHISLVGIPLALSRSALAAVQALGRVVWPRWPTPRWVDTSKTNAGRHTWRLKRLVRLGR